MVGDMVRKAGRGQTSGLGKSGKEMASAGKSLEACEQAQG